MAPQNNSEMKEVKIDSAIDFTLADFNSPSTEIWIMQWPFDHDKSNSPWPKLADFEGSEVTLKLNTTEGEFGSIQSSSGKSYELRSMESHTPEEFVFLTSASDTEIVGRVTRHVSVIHYPEASELQKPDKDIARKLGQRSSGTSLTGSARRTATPTQTTRSRHVQTSTGTISTPSSGKRGTSSIITGSSESSKSKKRKHANEASSSLGHSNGDSGRGHSAVTSSGGPHNQSQEIKSKRRKKNED
ncbi:hypothetical protein Leryth_004550 [Lithospermum erythrorhizon]|nr:hypothetical protein Leryth_004550 [Lithospermum erythrorhizon]